MKGIPRRCWRSLALVNDRDRATIEETGQQAEAGLQRVSYEALIFLSECHVVDALSLLKMPALSDDG